MKPPERWRSVLTTRSRRMRLCTPFEAREQRALDAGHRSSLNLSCRGRRRRPRNQRGMSTGSRMESMNTLWSALRSSRVGRSWESKCSCHCGFEDLVVGAGTERCFLSLIVRAPFRA